jgi:hypothetical protein
MTIEKFFARRYALGAFLFVGVALAFIWNYVRIGTDNPLGLVRLFALLAVLWLPWVIWTALTRRKTEGDTFVWRAFPAVARITFRDIVTVEHAGTGECDAPILLIGIPGKDGRAHKLRLTPYIFPRSDVRAFLAALRHHRPDLYGPNLP